MKAVPMGASPFPGAVRAEYRCLHSIGVYLNYYPRKSLHGAQISWSSLPRSSSGNPWRPGSIAPKQTYSEAPSNLIASNRSIIGVSLYPPLALKQALDFLARSRARLPLSRIASRVFPLDAINDREAGKEVLPEYTQLKNVYIDLS